MFGSEVHRCLYYVLLNFLVAGYVLGSGVVDHLTG